MSVNRHLPHVLVLPEDDANRQIANGFLLHHAIGNRKIQVLEEAGGWLHAVETEALRASLGSYESIGLRLAEDCYEMTGPSSLVDRSRFVHWNLMSRPLLFALLVLTLGCGSSPKPEEKAPAAEAPKIEAPKPEAAAAPADPGAPPETIFFKSEYGDVTFTHQKHFERVNGDCATCHPKIFPMAREPLNYGKARHRTAEEYKTSCAACHGITSTAFAAERNCQRCHDLDPRHKK